MNNNPNHPAYPVPVSLPPLAEFLRWLAEMPDAFRNEPYGFPQGRTRTSAVVHDLFETVAAARPGADFLRQFAAAKPNELERNRLRWVLAACHLLWHPALRNRALKGVPLTALEKLFLQDLAMLASVANVDGLFQVEERREELIRRAFETLGLRLPGESEAEARDRLTQVDSVERKRLMAEIAKRQEKLRKEEEVRRKAQEEAASKGPRE
ncbi:MAG: hypothetical protein HY291_22800 [Planctomycetes bacterium]|nr:hypothetical protein [Planctomycetota bacterium]